MVIVLDGLNSRQLAFVDLINQLPWPMAFVHDILNFQVKKGSLGIFNDFLEFLPVLKTSCHSVYIEEFATLFVPPLFGMFR